MPDCDVLFIGAGHNALVCAGYLAQAGYKVVMLERRHKAGGAVVTEEIVPGFKFDLGGSAHILINHTPIVRDLQLEAYGLRYLDIDPLFFTPFPDGSQITIYQDLDRTCQNIAAVHPQDAENYRTFVETWRPMAEGMVEAFLHVPTPLNLARYLVFNGGIDPQRSDQINSVIRSFGQVVRESFVGPQVPAIMGWMAAQSGPPPSEPLSAPFALWHPMYHASGVRRPVGGSGMLTQALAQMIQAHNGVIHTSAPVKRILVQGGRAVGAETESGERITARVVVSGAHIQTTARLLGDDLPAKARDLIGKARTGNGFGFMVRYAVNELPEYTALPTPPGAAHSEAHVGMQFICPSLDHIDRAYADYLRGEVSREPGLIVMTWSASDPSLAPAGKHVMFIWGQYYPYKLANGEDWDAIGQREGDRMLALLAKYAPNVSAPDFVIGQLNETPLYLERELGLLRGNVMHLEMSVDQMFMLRPALSMGTYRGPLKGLYLTGASTHPGGGIMGAAGRNAAAVVLHDLSRMRG
ncbi:MAG: NAD(P)/FAD-dependent oxidoreductase [Anaerolineae bacterium]|nr:NAD(P)/FAD-dependent oxidoreductase [Anaerolineae bacterium]